MKHSSVQEFHQNYVESYNHFSVQHHVAFKSETPMVLAIFHVVYYRMIYSHQSHSFVGLWWIFANHDLPNADETLGIPPHEVNISGLEYADDAGLFDINEQNASERVSSISIGSRREASMIISIPKTKAMHIHRKVKISDTTENDIAALHLRYKCPACNRDLPTSRGLKIHQARWCDGGQTIRSRKGSLASRSTS